MSFSGRTRAILIERTSEAYTHDQLDVLFMGLDIDGDPQLQQQQRRTKLRRVRRAVELLDHDGRVIDLVRELIEERYADSIASFGVRRELPQDLVESLRLDGFAVAEGRLVATTPGPVSLGPESSVLELVLEDRGFDVALVHYRQAVDSYVDGRREASNGQLRSFLEALLLDLCQETTGQRVGDPRGAVDRLRNAGAVDGNEAELLKGIVGVSNDRGAHAGLTDDEESLFRLHFATAAARYLLVRVR